MKINRIRQNLIPILFAALFASIAWTYLSIRSEPAPRPVNDVTLSVTPDYRIVSRKALTIWPAGTVFEQGLAAYFYAADPEITISPVVDTAGMDQGLINGTIQTQVYLQALDDKSQIYWRYLLNQTQDEAFTLSSEGSGQTFRSFTAVGVPVDVPAAYDTARSFGNELQFQNSRFQLIVTSDINLSGTVNDIPVEKSLVMTLPIELSQAGFSLPKSQDATLQAVIQKEAGEVSALQTFWDELQEYPLPFSADALLSIVILLLLAAGSRMKPKAAREHRRFKEWITEGNVDVRDRLSIQILSLEGLVDLAIDLDKRVIFDPGVRKYYVLTEDIVYLHDPERSYSMLENREQLGKLLIRRGLLLPEQLEIGLHYHKRIGIKLGESLIALGFIDETTLYSTLAAQQGIDYYELSPEDGLVSRNRLMEIGIEKARALIAVPLGERADKKLVVAAGEPARKGIRESLRELFNAEIHMTAARPSSIYRILDAMEVRGDENMIIPSPEVIKAPFERLSAQEQEQFLISYFRGSIHHILFLKASGMLDPAVLSRIPEKESTLPALVNKNLISSETANLIKGLDKAIEAADFKNRQKKQLPGLTELLLHSNYLTPETLDWIIRELPLQALSTEEFLRQNFLASEDTLRNAAIILNTLKSILYKA